MDTGFTLIEAKLPGSREVFRKLIVILSTEDTRPAKRTRIERAEDIKARMGLQALRNATTDQSPLLTIQDISFIAPQRKKLHLNLTSTGIQGMLPADVSNLELSIDYTEIRLVCILPVPDRASRSYNICIFPKMNDIEAVGANAIVFSVPDTVPKTVSGSILSSILPPVSDTYVSLLEHILLPYVKGGVVRPNKKDFKSPERQRQWNDEHANHVVARRGSKEGYLFFLSVGLVWGFKKPMLFLPVTEILHINFSGIFGKTFNLTVGCKRSTCDEKTAQAMSDLSIEFSVIDIVNHDAVNDYIAKYRLQFSPETHLASTTRLGPAVVTSQHDLTKRIETASAGTGRISTQSNGQGTQNHSDDEEEDATFSDSESHGGSTVDSDSTDASGTEALADDHGENDDEDTT